MIALGLLAAQLTSADAFAELEQLDRRLAATQVEIAMLAREIAQLQETVASQAVRLSQSTLREHEAFALLARRLRALCRLPAGSRLALLAGSTSLAEVLSTTRLLRSLGRHDLELHRTYSAARAALAREADALVAHRQKVDALLVTERQKRDVLAETRAQRVHLIEGTVRSSEALRELGTARAAAAQRILAALKRSYPAGRLTERFAQNRGRLPWPAVGALGRRFGELGDKSGTAVSHNGVDILAPAGAEVRAVAAGMVAFADWLPGFGQVVIIDHGEGHHTLYAHLAALAVNEGVVVNAGAPLGAVGDTGSLRGTLLYFEVRVQGVAQNPEVWLRR